MCSAVLVKERNFSLPVCSAVLVKERDFGLPSFVSPHYLCGMKKDIDFPKVTGVKVAIAKSVNELGESNWGVYIINNNLIELENVMIVSKGYEDQSEGRKTSTLRHMIQRLEGNSMAKVESIDPAVFSFNNEFWVSYHIINQMFDKKFLIKPFSEFEIAEIPELEMKGVLAD